MVILQFLVVAAAMVILQFLVVAAAFAVIDAVWLKLINRSTAATSATCWPNGPI